MMLTNQMMCDIMVTIKDGGSQMKQVYRECESISDAIALVASLLAADVSAYRQGHTVWVDDGGYDWGL